PAAAVPRLPEQPEAGMPGGRLDAMRPTTEEEARSDRVAVDTQAGRRRGRLDAIPAVDDGVEVAAAFAGGEASSPQPQAAVVGPQLEEEEPLQGRWQAGEARVVNPGDTSRVDDLAWHTCRDALLERSAQQPGREEEIDGVGGGGGGSEWGKKKGWRGGGATAEPLLA